MRWFPLLVSVLAAIAIAVIWLRSEYINPVLPTFLVLAGTSILIVLLVPTQFSMRWHWRMLIFISPLIIASLILLLLSRLFYFDGLTADLVPIFRIRSAPPPVPPPLVSRHLRVPTEVTATGHECTQFLGPHRNGTFVGNWDLQWNQNLPHELWRQPVGSGWSSFVIQGNLAVTQELRDDVELVVAYRLETGEVVWVYEYPGLQPGVPLSMGGPGPRCTPAISGNICAAINSRGTLTCLELTTGRATWSVDLALQGSELIPDEGYACSPLIIDDLVIAISPDVKNRSLLAYRLANGELVWTGGSHKMSYSSPMLAKLAGKSQVLFYNRDGLTSFEPTSGGELWHFPFSGILSNNVSQPLVLAPDQLLLSNDTTTCLVQIAWQDEKLVPIEIWQNRNLRTRFSNAILLDEHVFGLDAGILTCLDPKTGKRQWKQGRHGHGHVFTVGPTSLVLGDSGLLVALNLTTERPREIARLQVMDDKTWAVPAVAGPYLIVRSAYQAACYKMHSPAVP